MSVLQQDYAIGLFIKSFFVIPLCYLISCLWVAAIPLPDARTPPQVYFFDVVGQANTLFHLFEKQFMDSLVPLVM